MKRNTHKAIPIIQQAISSIGDDSAAKQAKNYLIAALNILERLNDRKNRKSELSKFYAEQSKKKYDEWWTKIKENAIKFAALENKNKENNNESNN